MAVREFLRIVQESAFLTPVVSPVLNTSFIETRLDEGNAFTMRPKPVQVPIKFGGGKATDAKIVSEKLEVKGQLKIKLTATQSPFLFGWAATLINAGQTLPWVTTEPPGDLPSCSVYHGIAKLDGTIKRRVYLGVKVAQWKVETSEDAQVITLTLDLVASTPQGNQFDASSDPNGTIFPVPTETDYPTDFYLFGHSAGLYAVNGTRTQYDALSLESTNALDARFFEARFVSVIRNFGRKTMLSATNAYKTSPDDRTTFEGSLSETASLTFNNGTHTLVFTLNTNNVYTALDDDLPLDKIYTQKLTVENLYDTSVPGDFAVTTT